MSLPIFRLSDWTESVFSELIRFVTADWLKVVLKIFQYVSYARDVESDLFKIFIKWAEKKPVLHQAGTKNKPAGNNALDSILSQVCS